MSLRRDYVASVSQYTLIMDRTSQPPDQLGTTEHLLGVFSSARVFSRTIYRVSVIHM